MGRPTFSADMREDLVTRVQKIFDDSNIALNVTDKKPTTDSLTVRFAKPLPSIDKTGDGVPDSRLLGKAYDINTPNIIHSIDQFDRRKDGYVAVFMDESDLASSIAETIAHEAGHGYGAVHINPGANVSEVMDYTDNPFKAPTFNSLVAEVVQFGADGKVEDTGETHNPQYHLRRFMVGEKKSDLLAKGITPGSWDETAFSLFGYKFTITELSTPVTNLSIVFDNPDVTAETAIGVDDGSISSVFLDSPLGAGDSFEFYLSDNRPFRMFGSTDSASELLDIAFTSGNSDSDWTLLNKNNDSWDGLLEIMLYDTGTGQTTRIGSADVIPFDGGEVSAEPVPLPNAALLMFTCLSVCTFAIRKRS
jgi:hypothetical protein